MTTRLTKAQLEQQLYEERTARVRNANRVVNLEQQLTAQTEELAKLRQQPDDAALTAYKDMVRTAVIREGEDRGLTCQELDEFLVEIDLKPRRALYKASVDVYFTASDDDDAITRLCEEVLEMAEDQSTELAAKNRAIRVDPYGRNSYVTFVADNISVEIVTPE